VTEVHVVDNALVAERVTRLRDSSTPNHEFRRLLRDLSSILVYEAMRQAPLETVDLVTPMGPAVGARLQQQNGLGGVFGQPGSQDGAGGTGPDDHIVILHRTASSRRIGSITVGLEVA